MWRRLVIDRLDLREQSTSLMISSHRDEGAAVCIRLLQDRCSLGSGLLQHFVVDVLLGVPHLQVEGGDLGHVFAELESQIRVEMEKLTEA